MPRTPLHRVRIKVCGMTRREDVRAAVALGIDALGFIFVQASPRCVGSEQAAALLDGLPPFIARVGVFSDAPLETVQDIVEACGLTQVQLHGDETPDYCSRLRSWRRGVSICKAFCIGGEHLPGHIDRYEQAIDSILLDTYVKGTSGGTGLSFDWRLVAHLRLHCPLILAGGLHPGNVSEAVRAVRPYAIDVNSGVESAPGIKDHDKIRRVVAAVRCVPPETD